MRAKTWLRVFGTVLAIPLAAGMLWAQAGMSIAQLRSFLKSSVELHQPDNSVANYLKRVKLSERLSPGQYEELLTLGLGSRTAEALRNLVNSSQALPEAAPEPVKAPAPVIPPPSPAEQQRILAEARDYAANYVKRLPDFLCVQVTRRYGDPSGLEFWQKLDTVQARLSFVEGKEDYSNVMVNNRLVTQGMLAVGGSVTTGEFGTLLAKIFSPESDASFTWERWTTLRGKRMYVFSYVIEQPRSQYTMVYQDTHMIKPGYHGSVYIDRATGAIQRIILIPDVPQSFPIQNAKTVLDYEPTDIGGQMYILPLRSESRSRDGKILFKNEVEFRMYRKFGAEATITFGDLDPLPESATQEEPVKQEPPATTEAKPVTPAKPARKP